MAPEDYMSHGHVRVGAAQRGPPLQASFSRVGLAARGFQATHHKTSLIRSPEGLIIGCSGSKPLSLFPLSCQPVLRRAVVLCGPDTWHPCFTLHSPALFVRHVSSVAKETFGCEGDVLPDPVCSSLGSSEDLLDHDPRAASPVVVPPPAPKQQVSAWTLCEKAFAGDLPGLRALFAKGHDMSVCDYDQRTALHLAAAGGHLDIVKFLLEEVCPVRCMCACEGACCRA